MTSTAKVRPLVAAMAVALLATAAGCSTSAPTSTAPASTGGGATTATSAPPTTSAPPSTTSAPKITLKVAYGEQAPSKQMTDFLTAAKAGFEAENPGVTVELQPIDASGDDVNTKLQLMQRSESTAPDVLTEDGFRINADAEAGFLLPLDSYVANWADWAQFSQGARDIGKAVDGKTYGISRGTDVQIIWYSKTVFEKAGLPTTWQPKTWQDIIDAAKAIKAKVPGTIPMNIYVSKPLGEATTMRTVLTFLSGTPDGMENGIYNSASNKWVTGSQGMKDVAAFLQQYHDLELGPTAVDQQNPNLYGLVMEQWLPAGKLGMAFDGSWNSGTWTETGNHPWPAWPTEVGWAAIPTQNGQAPGTTTMSGGWTWAASSKSKNPDMAAKFVLYLSSKENMLKFTLVSGDIPVRNDVASDPAYTSSKPTAQFIADQVKVTHVRPSVTLYPQVSDLLAQMSDSIITGSKDAAAATTWLDGQITAIAGADVVKATS